MSTKLNMSSQHQDIISCSDLIRSGAPAVYQLRTKKEKIGSLTRITVGEKDVNKINKTILLVGETGAGKSTLINALVNYSMGVKWEDGVWFQIVEDENKDQAGSQTSGVMVYQIFGFEGKTLPYSLTIIDTPGFGDTRGIEHDDINQRLFDLFRSKDGVHEINAVGMVIKGSDNQVHGRVSYIFNSVTSLFGKDLEKNIVALITHSVGRKPKNVLGALEKSNMKCARDEKNQLVYFLFNNCQHEDRTEEEEISLKHADEISERGLKQLISFLKKNEPNKVNQTVEVLNDRIRLAACIQNLQDRINLTELKQTEITQMQGVLKYRTSPVEVDEVYKVKQPIDGGMWWLQFYQGAVTCTVCEENCHYPGCTMALKPEQCEVMTDGRCTVCTNKCPASFHVKEKWIYVTKTRRVQKTLREVKESHEKNKSEGDKEKSVLEKREEEMKKLTSEKSQLLDEIYQHVVRLEQIALNVDSVSTLVHLDFLIEKMKEKGDTEKVHKLEGMKWSVDEGTRAALQYMWNVLIPATKNLK